ncbi:MAG: FKBP-type peptidyl-prolyl cis-trans isomerase [Bacteroidales bacterium]|jgi:FKBP-type peptidyl-prolyl cis-trans isomerase FklB|nr:FKBP-type peptidyl-prolyl cis-trans isomerase [Bacteroidales bacterium]
MKYQKFSLLFVGLSLFSLVCISAKPPQKNTEAPVAVQAPNVLAKTTDSVSYYLGFLYAKQIIQSFPNGFSPDAFAVGVKKAVDNDVSITDAEANQFLQKYFTEEQQRVSRAQLEEGKKFLAENAAKEGVTTLPSGLQYKILKAGTGAKPTATDKVQVMYHGTLTNGTVFDSAKERGEPVTFPVNGVIAGFSEALQLMGEGAVWVIYVPSELGYGANPDPRSGIPPNSVLIFEMELQSIITAEPAIPQVEPNLFK